MTQNSCLHDFKTSKLYHMQRENRTDPGKGVHNEFVFIIDHFVAIRIETISKLTKMTVIDIHCA